MNESTSIHNKIIKALSIFFSGQLLLFLASFISFPILTRILSIDDYGLLSLITISIIIFENIFSGGMAQSVLRFYGKYIKLNQIKQYFSSIINATLVLSIIGTLLLTLIIFFLMHQQYIQKNHAALYIYTSIIIIFRISWQIQQSFLRSQEKFFVVNTIDIFVRYCGIILGIFLLIYMRSLYGFFTGLIISEGIISLVIFYQYSLKNYLLFIDITMIKESMKYSIPLMFSILTAFFLTSGDRYLIAYFLDSKAVANYVVAYNFSSYGIELIKNICMFSFQPLILNAWNRNENNEGRQLIEGYIKVYSMVAIPAMVGLIAISQEGIVLLAGDKYSAVSYLVPILMSGIFLNGLNLVVESGFFFKNKTIYIAYMSTGVALLNCILNIILLPLMGLLGAAIATLISYFFYTAIGLIFSYRVLKFKIPIFSIFKYLLFSVVMVVIITNTPILIKSPLPTIIQKIVLGCLVYFCLIITFERHILRYFKTKKNIIS